MGKELDALILSMRPGIQLPSKRIEDDEEPAQPVPVAHRFSLRDAFSKPPIGWNGATYP